MELLPEILNNDSKEIGKTLVNGAIPKCLDNKFVIQKLEETLKKIKPELEFHVRNIQKHIADLQTIEEAYKLYEF